jgi:hypothetical protein
VSSIVNLTSTEAISVIGVGTDGRWQVTVVVKATYAWDRIGNAIPTDPRPLVTIDEFAGAPATTGLLRASDLGPLKPKVDVLLCGALAFVRPVVQTDVLLMVGTRLQKGARVYGDRAWLPGSVANLVPSQPRPVTRVPIAWERSYGGGDPQDPKNLDARNPAGSGMAKDPRSLHGKPAPSFEDPDKPIGAVVGRPGVIGFGPIAQHWQARVALAGTYDEAWDKSRRPLPPADFSPRFFNVASADQQLDGYVPGEDVRMLNMTTEGQDWFRLPELAVPVTIVTADEMSEATTEVDTVIIEPEERRLSLLGKVQASLGEGPQSVSQVVVGELTAGMRKALETGRRFPWERRRRSRA